MKITLPLLIILVSIIYGLPHIILGAKLGINYDPLVISVNSPVARDKTFAYAPQTSYVTKGDFFVKDVYVSEYSAYPTPFLGESFPSIIMALLSTVTNSVDKAFVVADFIFPPIIFFLLFYIAKMFIKNNFFALSVAALTAVARDFISVIPNPWATLDYFFHVNNQNYHLFLSRNFHPQVTFIFFLLAFIFLIKVVAYPDKKIFVIIFGITFGLLSYSYIFYWTYFLFFYCLVFLYFMFKRNLKILTVLFLSGSIFLLISSYYFINLYRFYNLPIAADFILKSSLEGQPFEWTIFRYLFLSLLFAYIFKKRGDKYAVFFLIMISAVFIAFSSRIILGQDLETLHYLRRAAMPFATIGFFIIVFFFIEENKRIVTLISSTILIISLIFALRVQIISTNKISQYHVRNIDQEIVFDWLEKNTPTDSVIGSLNTDFNSILPIYSHNKVYFPPTDRTITPTQEGVTRFAILSNLLGIQVTDQQKMLENKSLVTYLFVYQAYLPGGRGLSVNSLRNKQAKEKVKELSSTWQQAINNFKLDYLVITPKELNFIHPNTIHLQPITSLNQYIVFKAKRI